MDENEVKTLKRKREKRSSTSKKSKKTKLKEVSFNLENNEAYSDEVNCSIEENGSVTASKSPTKQENDKILESDNDNINESNENITKDANTSLYRNSNNDFENFKDVTADKLANAIKQSEEELEKMINNNAHLRDLRIILPFEPPPAHLIERSVVETQSKAHLELFKGMSINNKRFTKREDDLILSNFKEFCEAYKIEHDPQPFMHFVVGGVRLLNVKQRLQFVRYIGRGLNDRKLHSIYQRFQLLFSNVNKGRFSLIEDHIILTYVKNNEKDKQKFSNVAKILNRSKEQILKRYLSITEWDQDDFKNMTGLEKVEYFVSVIMRVLDVSTINQLKKTTITKKRWREISQEMNDVPIHQLTRFWNVSVKTRLFNENIQINKVLKEIIKVLHERKIEDWKEINWSELTKPYERKYYTCPFIYDKFKDVRKCHIPKEYRNDPKVCIRMLKNLFDKYPALLKKVQSYEYEDGKIKKC